MYAIVRAGGRQHKVAVGDVVEVDRLADAAGGSVTLPALLVVDGDRLTTAADELAGVAVRAEVLAEIKGPKIRILKYKNKTGYRKRQGHRQRHTRLRVLGIDTPSSASADPVSTGSTAAVATASVATEPVSTGSVSPGPVGADQAGPDPLGTGQVSTGPVGAEQASPDPLGTGPAGTTPLGTGATSTEEQA